MSNRTKSCILPAWDYIQFDAVVAEQVATSDFFVYGTLAARDHTTHDTLLRYLDKTGRPNGCVAVFDVNLRPPHYTASQKKTAQTLELFGFARIVKVNEHELRRSDPAGSRHLKMKNKP